MTDGPDFTMGDLLQQLAEEFGCALNDEDSSGAYTSAELCEITGLSKYKVMKFLKEKHGKGELDIVEKKVVCFGSDRELPVSAYRLKEREDHGED